MEAPEEREREREKRHYPEIKEVVAALSFRIPPRPQYGDANN